MKPLRVLVATVKELVPPDSIEGMTDEELAPYKTDFDVVSGLRDLGHDVEIVGLSTDLDELRNAIADHRPHIVFNLLNEFAGREEFVTYVLGYLELIGQPYTGCNPVGMMFSHDKALQRKIMRHHGLDVPDFAIARANARFKRPGNLPFPLIVKSLSEHGSFGITQASIVHSEAKLAKRIEYVHDQLGTHAIVEQYIEGRELYLGIIGNQRLENFPVWELRFTKLPKGAQRIATYKVKWDLGYQERIGVKTGVAKLPEDMRNRIIRSCKHAYRVLDQTGYARLDLRLEDSGKAYIIESNPNPQLSFGEDFAESAEVGGIQYTELLARILSLGLSHARANQH